MLHNEMQQEVMESPRDSDSGKAKQVRMPGEGDKIIPPLPQTHDAGSSNNIAMQNSNDQQSNLHNSSEGNDSDTANLEGHSPTNMDENPQSSPLSSPIPHQMEVKKSEARCLQDIPHGDEIMAPLDPQGPVCTEITNPS